MARGLGRRLDDMVEAVVAHLGYELVAIERLTQGRDTVLRIYIDNLDEETGITVDDCERVSRQLGALFDVEEPVTGRYSLEVSSPGLDRLLTKAAHYTRFLGQRARIQLLRPHDGRRQFVGRILAVADGRVSLEADDGQRFDIALEDVDRARLVPTY